MFLIVGLGNPGIKYENTRHNTGFLFLDELQKKNNLADFKSSKKFKAMISEGKIAEEKIILAKPGTFMNQSGQSIKKFIKNYKLKIKNLLVIHDDIDLPLGKIKISKSRGSAGHKGIESIIKELSTKNFVRIRIGIQLKTGKPRKSEDFVLGNFNLKEKKDLKDIFKKSSKIIETIIEEGIEKAMNEFN